MDFATNIPNVRVLLRDSFPAPAYDSDNNKIPGQQAVTRDGNPIWNNLVIVAPKGVGPDGRRKRSAELFVKTAGPNPPIIDQLTPVVLENLTIRLYGDRLERHSLWASDIVPVQD